MLKTKIVCTIGLRSREPAVLREIILAGMNVARLNFSHGDQSVHGGNIERIRTLSEQVESPVAILVDLQGPKLRVRTLPDAGIMLMSAATAILTSEPIVEHLDDRGNAHVSM